MYSHISAPEARSRDSQFNSIDAIPFNNSLNGPVDSAAINSGSIWRAQGLVPNSSQDPFGAGIWSNNSSSSLNTSWPKEPRPSDHTSWAGLGEGHGAGVEDSYGTQRWGKAEVNQQTPWNVDTVGTGLY